MRWVVGRGGEWVGRRCGGWALGEKGGVGMRDRRGGVGGGLLPRALQY